MLFNSFPFLIFFPIVVLVYYAIPHRFRYLWLLVTSYYFYMSWYPKWAILLLFSTVITWLSGLILERIKCQDWEESKKTFWKKWCVFFSFGANLAMLGVFKYTNFVLENLNRLLAVCRMEALDVSFGLALPVGISFYVFQALSYTMDVYRDDIYAEKNFLKYALFVSFFPQLVAGPIERSKNLLRQIDTKKRLTRDRFLEGMLLMLWGYFLKLVIADRIALFVDPVYEQDTVFTGWYLIVASVLFAFQIYCDFAGYSTIAVGAAKVMGFELMENFDCPYFSRSVAEFWRRWHISLTSWFRDYLYIPLGGSRKGKGKKYRNIMIVFLVSGLWHGANWTYVIWGGLNGVFQVLGELTKRFRRKLGAVFGARPDTTGHKLLEAGITFALVDFAWIFFRAESLPSAVRILNSIFHARNIWILFDGSLYEAGLDQKNFWILLLSLAILFFADALKHRGVRLSKSLLRQEWWVLYAVFFVGVFSILVFGIWGSSYSAGSFIYFQF